MHLNRTGLIFKLPFYRQIYYQLAISYNRETDITHAIILAEPGENILSPLLAHLKDRTGSQLFRHPLQLPILAIELEIENINNRLHASDHEINDLEQSMGQHEYENTPRGSPLEIDFTTTTRKLNFITKRVGVDTLTSGVFSWL